MDAATRGGRKVFLNEPTNGLDTFTAYKVGAPGHTQTSR